MKKIDISKSVMDKIIGFEKRRLILWLGRLLLLFLVLLGVWGLLFFDTVQKMLLTQSFSLLALFGEDKEIVANYWQDTLQTFFLELPIGQVILILVIILLIIGLLLFTKSRWRIFKKKLAATKKYLKDRLLNKKGGGQGG